MAHPAHPGTTGLVGRGSSYVIFYHMIWLKTLDSLGNRQSPLQKRRLFLGRQSGSSKGQFTLLWSLFGVPKIYFNEGDNSGWHSFRKLFFCAHGSRPAWLPTSLFGMVEGCKEPDQHQLVYGVSAIKGRKVVEKMCLRPGLTHSAKALWFFPQIREQMSGPEIS